MASPPTPESPEDGPEPAAAGGVVVKCGYLRKLKHGHKRFFVLRAGGGGEEDEAGARLEYYESEKKWRGKAAAAVGAAPRRAVALAACLAVHKRADAKHRHLLALYARDESWALAAESAAERDAWFEALSRLLRPAPGGAAPAGGYGEVWQVRLKARGLGASRRLTGVHRLCLAARWLALVRPPGERPAVTLQLAAVRRCGHAESCFFLELGRSAAPGPGELWMQADDALAAQHIHESVLRAMRALRQAPEAARPRSKSHSAGGAAAAPRRRLRRPLPRARTASEGDAPPTPAPRQRTRSLTAPAPPRAPAPPPASASLDEGALRRAACPEDSREPEVGSAGSSSSSGGGGSRRGPDYVPMSPSSVSAPRQILRARPAAKGSSESSPEDWGYVPMGGPGAWRAARSPDYVPMAPARRRPSPEGGFAGRARPSRPGALGKEEPGEPPYVHMAPLAGRLSRSPDGAPCPAAAARRQAGTPLAARTERFLGRPAWSRPRPAHLCLGREAPLPQQPRRPGGDYVSLGYPRVPAASPGSPLSGYMTMELNVRRSVEEAPPGDPHRLGTGAAPLPSPSSEPEDAAAVAFPTAAPRPESPPADSPLAGGLERLTLSEVEAFLVAHPPPEPHRGAKVVRADPRGRRRHSSETFASTGPAAAAAASPSFAPGAARPSSASAENVSLRRGGGGPAEEPRGSPMCRETSAGFQHGLNRIALDAAEGGRPLAGAIIADAYASREFLPHSVKEAASVKVC